MSSKGPFGFDPEDIDRIAREASAGLRDAAEKVGRFLDDAGIPYSHSFDVGTSTSWPRPRSRRDTAGETGDGVWAIYIVDDDGSARVDQVFATELEALRAHKNNTDPRRLVRFLPYGVTVSVLDENTADSDTPDAARTDYTEPDVGGDTGPYPADS
ncbi:hypothetical protein [Rhodococcus sp. NPDC058514]|uniref:hypothetical protein n=1 Tax=unclassified Rhodococcus (in: high G+C Gram-positive bacteria) TaxID=192944 RepID=UPI00365C8697